MKSLSSHLSNLNMKDLLQCNICDSVFSTSDSLLSHLEEHNDVLRLYKCGVCDASFLTNVELLDHLNGNHGGLPLYYKCRLCSLSFKDILQLVTHLNLKGKHSKFEFRCCSCGQEFKQEKELLLHLQSHWPIEVSSQVSKCPICFSKLPASIMRDHLLSHGGEKGKIASLFGRVSDPIKPKKRICKQNSGIKVKLKDDVEGTKEMVENESVTLDSDMERTEAEREEAKPEVGVTMRVKRGRKRREVGNLKSDPMMRKPTPAIKDTKKLIEAYMKVDSQNGMEIFDCDVCGIRINDRGYFIEHRDSHFCDGKFCINCRHCSQTFDSFEDLENHIGPDKCTGYICKICGKSFSLEPNLLTHRVKEHFDLTKQDGVLTCAVCGKTFENKTAFLRHASSHSEDKCIQCKLCKHAFTTQETLLGHLRTTHSVIQLTRRRYKFICGLCGANFMKDEALSTHKAHVHNVEQISSSFTKPDLKLKALRQESKRTMSKSSSVKRTGHWRSDEDDKKRRTCPICNRVFRRFKDVRRHIGTHTKPHLCSHCGKSFPYRYSLDAHTKAYHSTENRHKCETCNKFFSCKRSLMIHQRIHTGEKPHQCHICHKNFRQVANLSMHVKLHSTEKPIKCTLCDYRCSHQGYLKRHMGTHSTEKLYTCSICDKGFTEKTNLNHHLKRHSKIKKHVCTVCGHRFAERYYLNDHMRIHTKEKPYICPVCKRAFTMRPNMVSHIKKTHPSYKYQPLRPPHKQTSNMESNNVTITTNENEVRDPITLETGGQPVSETAFTTLTTMAVSIPGSVLPTISYGPNSEYGREMTSTTPQPLITRLLESSQLPDIPSQLQQSSESPLNNPIFPGTNNAFPQQLNNPTPLVKSDELRFAQPRDLLDNFPLHRQRKQRVQLQAQQQHVQGVVQGAISQGSENFQRNSDGNQEDQHTTESHQYNLNTSDRCFSSHLVDAPQTVTLSSAEPFVQNPPSVPLVVGQDYGVYAFPSVPPSYDSTLPASVQGFFLEHQNQNPNSQTYHTNP